MEVNANEALRYLGYRGTSADRQTLRLLEECAGELEEKVSPHHCFRMDPVTFFDDGTLKIGELKIASRQLSRHLSGCREAALFAATLGPQADLLVQKYSALDMTRAVMMQACAASLIESYCDECGEMIARQAAPRGLFLRPRFSPGYSDFPISFQKPLLDILDAPKRIGLTVTDSLMLAPSKSVTAVIGLTPEPQSCHIEKCAACGAEDCPFRKEPKA